MRAKVSQQVVAHVGAVPPGDEDRIGELKQLGEFMLDRLRNTDRRQIPLIAQGSLAQAVEDSRELLSMSTLNVPFMATQNIPLLANSGDGEAKGTERL